MQIMTWSLDSARKLKSMVDPPASRPKGIEREQNRYQKLVDKVFFDRYQVGDREITFKRQDLEDAALTLGIKLPKNIGDIIYSFRFRTALSDRMLATQPAGLAWRIELAGSGVYRFVLGPESKVVPDPAMPTLNVPNATPAIIAKYALGDEQALLAVVRYNRLIDIFLGLTAYSLQNHLRTTVRDVGQIEIDELYIGIDREGSHYVIPVQAKGGTDQISVVQTDQDMRACAQKFPALSCRPVSVQFMPDKTIAMFELTLLNGELKVVSERHYRLGD